MTHPLGPPTRDTRPRRPAARGASMPAGPVLPRGRRSRAPRGTTAVACGRLQAPQCALGGGVVQLGLAKPLSPSCCRLARRGSPGEASGVFSWGVGNCSTCCPWGRLGDWRPFHFRTFASRPRPGRNAILLKIIFRGLKEEIRTNVIFSKNEKIFTKNFFVFSKNQYGSGFRTV